MDDAPIEFVVPETCEEYLDSAHTLLRLRVLINHSPPDESKLHNTVKVQMPIVGPINNFMHSFFSHLDVSFNQSL